MHGTMSSVPQCHTWGLRYCEDLLHHRLLDDLQNTVTMDKAIGKCIQQYSGHIVLYNRWEPSGLSWRDVIVLPGVRRTAEHMEDLAQLHHTELLGGTILYHTIRQEQRIQSIQ